MGSLHHLHRPFAAPRDANDLRGSDLLRHIEAARETGEAVTTPAASSVNIWDTFEERERRARVAADELRDARHRRLQAIIHWSCIVVALATLVYFAAEFLR